MDFETPLLLTLVSKNSPLAVATLNWLVCWPSLRMQVLASLFVPMTLM